MGSVECWGGPAAGLEEAVGVLLGVGEGGGWDGMRRDRMEDVLMASSPLRFGGQSLRAAYGRRAARMEWRTFQWVAPPPCRVDGKEDLSMASAPKDGMEDISMAAPPP